MHELYTPVELVEALAIALYRAGRIIERAREDAAFRVIGARGAVARDVVHRHRLEVGIGCNHAAANGYRPDRQLSRVRQRRPGRAARNRIDEGVGHVRRRGE